MGFYTFQLPVYILAGICILSRENVLVSADKQVPRGTWPLEGTQPYQCSTHAVCGSSRRYPFQLHPNKTRHQAQRRSCRRFFRNLVALSFLFLECFTAAVQITGHELDGTARWEAMSVPGRDFPASLQHSEVPQREGGVASITTAGKTLLQSLPPCSQLKKSFVFPFWPTQKAFLLATIVETFLAKLLAHVHTNTHTDT